MENEAVITDINPTYMINLTLNSTMVDDPDGKSLLDVFRFWVQRVLVPTVVCIGVVGNLVTVIVLTRRRMSSSTNTYLTALAVADLMYLLFTYYLSFENSPTIKNNYWYWYLNPINHWFIDAMSAVSVWLTVSFTVERYIAVCHPLRGKVLCTEKRARRVICIVFVIGFLTTMTTPFEQSVSRATNSTTVIIDQTELAKNTIYKSVFYWFWAFAYVVIPLILLAIMNAILIKTVRRSRKQRSGLTEVKHCGTNNRQKQENKITMTLIAVVFLFIFCQTPQAFLLIVYYFYDPDRPHPDYYTIRIFGLLSNFLVAVNAASNFMLYCAMSDKYKRTLILIFFPCFVNKHKRINTFNSNVASYEHSSIPLVNNNINNS